MIDATALLRPRRHVTGISAILLPFTSDGQVDWPALEQHVQRTVDAGLQPAVNMDTGYGHLIDDSIREAVLQRTQRIAGDESFVAGAFVGGAPGSAFDRDGYARQIELIRQYAGTPVIFQSFGLTSQSDEQIVDSYAELARLCERLIAFELGEVFAPFGKIYSLDVYQGLLDIPQCIGAKHSSLRRDLEWERLILRDATRPDFHVFTGNDLAIDMVMYGSDYLLGLSTFAPDYFAQRDRYWETGDPRFYALNDLLQYLGFFAFRSPVPAYKHSAAMFLKLRDWIATDQTHPQSPERPESDREVLAGILQMLQELT